MKILVTGASGRVGANLTKALLDRGHTVRAFIFPQDASRMHKLDAYNVDIQQGDLRDYDAVAKAVTGMDAVYHIGAAMIGPFQNADYFDINAKGTFNVVEAVRQNCPNLHRLIYAGTDATYPTFPDTGPEQSATEDMHVEPTGLYALSKWMGERLVLNHYRQYGTPSVIFRFAWVIGAGEILDPNYTRMYWLSKVRDQYAAQRGKSAEADQIADQLDALWPGEERMLVTYSSSGKSHSMYFVDVRDLLQGLLLGLDKPEAVGEVFNLPGQRRWLHSEVAPYISQRIGVPDVELTMPRPASYRGLSW
ncbi:MAG: NAD(P)-dependent oxidoreductase, partial [Chloroflexota bacterium]